jgi:hypothetical protein
MRKMLRLTVRLFGMITHGYTVAKRIERYEWRD